MIKISKFTDKTLKEIVEERFPENSQAIIDVFNAGIEAKKSSSDLMQDLLDIVIPGLTSEKKKDLIDLFHLRQHIKVTKPPSNL